MLKSTIHRYPLTVHHATITCGKGEFLFKIFKMLYSYFYIATIKISCLALICCITESSTMLLI